MSIKHSLGLKIKELRKKQKISQEKFSEMIDMHPRQIVRIENGESFPTAENLEKIISALDIPISELFCDNYFESDEYYINEIYKNLKTLSNKELRLVNLLVKNL